MWTLSHLCEHILTFEWDHSIVLNSGPGTLHAGFTEFQTNGVEKKNWECQSLFIHSTFLDQSTAN